MAKKEDLRVGMSVSFGQFDGGMTDGVIVKINPKRVKVRTVQPRGTAPAGVEWSVPPSMITIREDKDFAKDVPSEKEVIAKKIVSMMLKHGITVSDLQAANVEG